MNTTPEPKLYQALVIDRNGDYDADPVDWYLDCRAFGVDATFTSPRDDRAAGKAELLRLVAEQLGNGSPQPDEDCVNAGGYDELIVVFGTQVVFVEDLPEPLQRVVQFIFDGELAYTFLDDPDQAGIAPEDADLMSALAAWAMTVGADICDRCDTFVDVARTATS